MTDFFIKSWNVSNWNTWWFNPLWKYFIRQNHSGPQIRASDPRLCHLALLLQCFFKLDFSKKKMTWDWIIRANDAWKFEKIIKISLLFRILRPSGTGLNFQPQAREFLIKTSVSTLKSPIFPLSWALPWWKIHLLEKLYLTSNISNIKAVLNGIYILFGLKNTFHYK